MSDLATTCRVFDDDGPLRSAEYHAYYAPSQEEVAKALEHFRQLETDSTEPESC